MTKKTKWFWTFLFWLYLFTISSNTIVFFNPQSPTKIYYQILLSFNTIFLIPYLLNLLAIILDILAVFPFFNYLNPQKNFIWEKHISTNFWKWFFAIRLSLLFLGRSFESKELQSILHNDIRVTLTIIIAMLIIEGPSHIAVFLFAHRQKSNQNHKK